MTRYVAKNPRIPRITPTPENHAKILAAAEVFHSQPRVMEHLSRKFNDWLKNYDLAGEIFNEATMIPDHDLERPISLNRPVVIRKISDVDGPINR